jgi:hypothetical protein
VSEDDLREFLVLDTVGLGALVPGREVEPGERWTVPIDEITGLFGKRPPGARHEGSIEARFIRRVLYDGTECAHIGLTIDLLQHDETSRDVPSIKTTRMMLEGEIYFAIAEGRPVHAHLSGPITIEYQPRGEAPAAFLSRPFSLQGKIVLQIAFERF